MTLPEQITALLGDDWTHRTRAGSANHAWALDDPDSWITAAEMVAGTWRVLVSALSQPDGQMLQAELVDSADVLPARLARLLAAFGLAADPAAGLRARVQELEQQLAEYEQPAYSGGDQPYIHDCRLVEWWTADELAGEGQGCDACDAGPEYGTWRPLYVRRAVKA
jgi:hypothetical protein